MGNMLACKPWPACSGGGTVDLMSACAGASRVEVTRRPNDIQASSVELPSRVKQSNGAITRSGRLFIKGEMPLHCKVHAYSCIVMIVASPTGALTWHESDVHPVMIALVCMCACLPWLHV